MQARPPEVVEFLDGEGDGPGDAVTGARDSRRPVAIGLLLVSALAIAGVLVRATSGGSGRSVAAPAPSPVAVSTVGASIGAGQPVLRQPVPHLQLLPTPSCPGGCVVIDWVADATLYALDSAFPGATVQRTLTAFGPGRFGALHPLLAREVRAERAGTVVVIDVVQRPEVGQDLVSDQDTSVDVTRHGAVTLGAALAPGYRIAVRVTGAGPAVEHRLAILLADPGLMAVR